MQLKYDKSSQNIFGRIVAEKYAFFVKKLKEFISSGYSASFTLIELMLVIIIIGILAATAIPKFTGRSEQARIVATRSDIEASLGVALDLFEVDNGFHPTTEQGLQALITKPGTLPAAENWRGPYLKRNEIPKDSWGRLYQYRCPGSHNTKGYDLYSFGRDGTEGGGDDITNWTQGK